jgi:chorismate mutase
MDPSQDPVVRAFREEISEADRLILETINRRIEIVSNLHEYKAEHGYPPGDPAREAALIEELERLNPGPLSSDGLRTLYTAILGEWKRQPPPATRAAAG